jgi:hypothetical protein
MRRRHRWRRLIVWGVIFVTAVMAGALGFAYTYMTDSSTLVSLINARLPDYLPGSELRVDKASLRPILGQFDLRQVTLVQSLDERGFSTLRIPWLQVRCDLQALWHGQIRPREVIVAQPILRLTRRQDGRWNVEGLLADPWPNTPQFKPVIRISKGVLELADGPHPAKVLHDVDLTLEPDGEIDGLFHFDGSGQGDAFDRFTLAGTLNALNGSVCLERSEITGLTVSETLRHRLPADLQEAWNGMGLTSGRLDVVLEHLTCGRATGRPMSYAVRVALHDGAWHCARLPFPLSEVSGSARIQDGHVDVAWAEARYGRTMVRVHRGTLDLNRPDPTSGPLDLDVSVVDLDLDGRLKSELSAPLAHLWELFAPEGRDALGRISLRARLTRTAAEPELAYAVTIDLLDVALRYRWFPFPLEHVQGRMVLQGSTLLIEHLQTLVGLGGQPLTAKGKIERLGDDPEVTFELSAGALPIDQDGPLVRALPPSLESLVNSFHPRGTVGATALVHRRSIGVAHSNDPMAGVEIHATLDLNPDCSMCWDGLPYAVRRLTGQLVLDPKGCTFRDMAGENGVARIAAHGRVDSAPGGTYCADVTLHADRLPFDQQLRESLPRAWQATWGLLNPVGTSTLDAHVTAGRPGEPDRTELKLRVSREDEARVKLSLLPVPGTPGLTPGQRIELPAMQGVTGEFVFDNGPVTMTGVSFFFREAPVWFRSGKVDLRETGQFDLRVEDLQVKKLRLDPELRRIMPSLMAQFAEHLGEADQLAFHSNLSIAWSGEPEQPAVCSWDQAQIIFQDNTIISGVPLQHIQGRMADVSGRSDGRGLEFSGRLQIDSVIVAEQQVTNLTSPLIVSGGKATLSDATGRLLGGTLRGQMEMTLASTPEYRGWVEIHEADLTKFTQTLPGRQTIAGRVSAQAEVSGVGNDLRRLSGTGSAQLVQGDLGKLPWFFRLVSPLNLARGNPAAFDAANLVFVIKDGEFQLDPIKITGNTLSLYGRGTIKAPGELDLELKPLYGRDERLHIPGFSDATREATGQVVLIRAKGPLADPRVGVEVLPGPSRRVADFLKRFADRDPDPLRERESRPFRSQRQ